MYMLMYTYALAMNKRDNIWTFYIKKKRLLPQLS